jgi:hypothetical protein
MRRFLMFLGSLFFLRALRRWMSQRRTYYYD